MRPVEELRYLILAAQREGNRMLAQQLRPLGVTPAQAEALRVLEDRAPLTLSGLGELLVCENGTNPSRLVDRLVSAGLVSRTEVAADRRQVQITLTAAGRRLARRIARIEEDLYGAITAAGADQDLSDVLEFLRTFLAGTSSGAAVAKRRIPLERQTA